MKKTTLTLSFLMLLAVQTLFATKHTIVTSGFTFSPSSVTANLGDTVSIAGSTTHPAVQVDQTTWNANSNTPMAGGWGTKTTTYTFTITSTNTIYYVCANHVSSMQMKGLINVISSGVNQVSSPSLNISVYPNPVTNGELTVKAEGYTGSNGKIVIYDTEGKALETHALTGASTTVKSKLPSGVYFYDVIVNNKQAYRGKFLMTLSK